MSSDERIDRARLYYERAVFFDEFDALESAVKDLDEVEADLALARGKIIHGRFLQRRAAGSPDASDNSAATDNSDELAYFEQAAQLYKGIGERRGEAEALFWIGCFYQVVQRDRATAAEYLDRCCEMSAQAGDKLTRSDALRLIAVAEHMAGDSASARDRLEESTRLRREIGFAPGVASNHVGLAYITAGLGRKEEALSLLDAADVIAAACGAHGVARQVKEARGDLADQS